MPAAPGIRPCRAAGRETLGRHRAGRRRVPGVRKPALHALHDRTGDGYAYRAELSAFVDEPLLSPHPVLRDELDLPGPWFETIRTNLSAIAATPTDRTAMRQEWISRAVPEYTGHPAPQITQWACAHGDFHAANLTTRPHDPRLGRLGHCSPGIRLPDADHDKGGDRQLHQASPDDRRPLGPAVSDDAVGLIHLTSRGLPRSVNNIALQSLIAAFADEKSIVDEPSTRLAITETHATE
ncbi:hypothetical protein [Streptomyces sp. GbtcB7]|uniref:hypothetical protein n=1 Tax=Streptomyces sp. GbtcB7 TaxID=2824752 RepID=UPI001C30008B|nr:hypothetical protein [Streptomyces sp. GbtcB7]